MLGNIEFDGSMRNENDPCEVKQLELVESVSELMGIPKKELAEGMVFHRKVIAGETMLIPLTVKQCV